MNSHKNTQKDAKRQALSCVFCAFLWLSFSVFILGAAEKENAPFNPLNYAAISYFNERCARCHGPDGVNYDLKHLAQSSDEKLRAVILAMAENQGQAPLEAAQVEVQLAYHRSFLDGKPFVMVTGAKTENGQLLLSGEATPEARVQLCLGEKTYAAKREEQNWQATLPADTNWQEVIIVASKGNAKTQLKASEIFSHRK